MIKLSKLQHAQLRKLQQDPAWEVVTMCLDAYVTMLKTHEVAGVDAFQELRELHKSQGGAESLMAFFENLERGAFDD